MYLKAKEVSIPSLTLNTDHLNLTFKKVFYKKIFLTQALFANNKYTKAMWQKYSAVSLYRQLTVYAKDSLRHFSSLFLPSAMPYMPHATCLPLHAAWKNVRIILWMFNYKPSTKRILRFLSSNVLAENRRE